MFKYTIPLIFSAALIAAAPAEAGSANHQGQIEISYLDVKPNIKLRQMVAGPADSTNAVLLLHGFPETMLVWKNIASELSKDHRVYAIDWPGYGFSSRPPVSEFSYSPRDYAAVLDAYIDAAKIDRAKLTIYATDIGSLPVLLAAINDKAIARNIIVGDFAPFNRPEYMYDTLQSLKSEPSASQTRAYMNANSAEILANAYRRGLPPEKQFDLAPEVLKDMTEGWSNGAISSADAFYQYYSKFTRDQDYLELHLGKLKTPVKVVWGADDIYINKAMGEEFSRKTGAAFSILPGIGHYPHLQAPQDAISEIRAEK